MPSITHSDKTTPQFKSHDKHKSIWPLQTFTQTQIQSCGKHTYTTTLTSHGQPAATLTLTTAIALTRLTQVAVNFQRASVPPHNYCFMTTIAHSRTKTEFNKALQIANARASHDNAVFQHLRNDLQHL
eukprot:6492722-Amphidinium_carterae.4